jgi:hypothetical protein
MTASRRPSLIRGNRADEVLELLQKDGKMRSYRGCVVRYDAS